MQKTAHRWLFYCSALLYIAQQYRVHSLSPHQYVETSGDVSSLLFSILLLCMMVYVLFMTLFCLVHLFRQNGSHRLQWIFMILGLPLVGAYLYLERRLFPSPANLSAPTDRLARNSSDRASRLEGVLSISAFVITLIAAGVFALLFGLRILFEVGEPLLLGSKWGDVYEAFLGPAKVLLVAGLLLGVVALVKEWPFQRLSRISMVVYGAILWTYIGIMWWQQLKPAEVVGIAIVEQGLFQLSGDGASSSDYALVRTADSINAEPGTRFGVKYIVVGRPAGTPIRCNVLWKFPSPGIRDSASGAYRMSHIEETTSAIGDRSSAIYCLRSPSDLISGEWVVQVRDQYGDIDERHFIVQKPD